MPRVIIPKRSLLNDNILDSCDNPSQWYHGFTRPFQIGGRFPVGSNVTFTCELGIQLNRVVNKFSICQQNYSWYPRPPYYGCIEGEKKVTRLS